MVEALKAFGLVFGGGLGLWYGVAKFFKFIEDGINEETKAAVSNWLRGRKAQVLDASGQPASSPSQFQEWPETFARLFDRVFTERHLSWKCFFRSCVASLITTSLLYLITLMRARAMAEEWEWFASESIWSAGLWEGLKGALLFVSLLNLLPDYISLLETRWVIGRMRKRPSGIKTIGFMVFDLVLTCLIVVCSAIVVAKILLYVWDLTWVKIPPIATILDGLREVLIWNNMDFEMVTPPVYSTFSTSAWIWLYAISGFLVKAAVRIQGIWHFLRGILDIEKKPLQSIGRVAGLLVALVYWGFLLLSWASNGSA